MTKQDPNAEHRTERQEAAERARGQRATHGPADLPRLIQWTRHETDAKGLRSPHWTATYRNRQAIVAEVDFSWVVYGGPREDCGHARSLKTAKQIAVRRMIGGAS